MYTYSTMPIPVYDASTDYGMLIIWALIILFFTFIFVLIFEAINAWWFGIVAAATGVFLHLTLFSGTYIEYENTKVVGKFEEFITEGFKPTTGKSKPDTHVIYAKYSIEGNVVLFPVSAGETIAKYAYFYKNPVKE